MAELVRRSPSVALFEPATKYQLSLVYHHNADKCSRELGRGLAAVARSLPPQCTLVAAAIQTHHIVAPHILIQLAIM